MNKYSIGETAKLTGLPTKTIRFYEDEGVISPALRGENGYRKYPVSAIDELKILKYARDLGLPLSEIKKLMRGCGNGDCQHTRKYIETSIENYLTLLDGKISQMQMLKSKLTGLSRKFKTNDVSCDQGAFCCDILHQLIEDTPKEVRKNERTN